MVSNINKLHHYPQHYQHFQHQSIHYYSLERKMDKYPRDLLGAFDIRGGGGDARDDRFNVNANVSPNQQRDVGGDDDDEEEVELNLGLSLGGRFGVDKNAKKTKLMRSSSVVGTMPLFRDEEALAPSAAVFPALMRTSSLPTETEEEWRRRKEIQTLRRLEAKRRRSEKMRGAREVDGAGDEVTVPAAAPAAPAKQVVLGEVLGKGKGFRRLFGQPCSQGSMDSQGGSSSSVSEMDSKVFLGSGSCGEAKSPASNQSTLERSSSNVVGSGAKANENVARASKAEVENPPKKPNSTKNLMGREIGSNAMGDMPCVFTKGDGPNGRRIEGILYKYGKGQEVRIMCVCHGNFLSPAEFVKHAGGGDVAHPLRHIVVNTSASPFL